MTFRLVAAMGALLLLLAGLPAVAFAQAAQATASPAQQFRTRWGEPDLEGIWSGETLTPLQRPARFSSKPVLTPEEDAKVVAEVFARPGREDRSFRGTERMWPAPTTRSSSSVVPSFLMV